MFKEIVLDTDLKFNTAALFVTLETLLGCTIDTSLNCLPVTLISYATAMINDLSVKLQDVVFAAKNPEKDKIGQEKEIFESLKNCVEIHLKI